MYIGIILRTLFMYFFIIFAYRLMGKKEVGQLSIIDLIVSILIAELVALAIEGKNHSLLMSVVPIMVLVGVQIFISFVTLKNEKIRDLIDGKPVVLIKNGRLNFTEMSKLRYSLDDLISQLRLQGVKSIDKVKYAVLENNGNLSVFQDDADYPLPLILDGDIDKDVLKELDKDYDWLLNHLRKRNLELDEVFYAFYISSKLFVITRDELL